MEVQLALYFCHTGVEYMFWYSEFCTLDFLTFLPDLVTRHEPSAVRIHNAMICP